METMDRAWQRNTIARAVKDPYAVRRAWFFTKVVLREDDNGSTGSREHRVVWPGEKYILYKGRRLALEYELHLTLPENVWYPGVECNPFLVFHHGSGSWRR